MSKPLRQPARAVEVGTVDKFQGREAAAAAFAEAAAAARLQVLRSGGARQDLPGELRAKLEPSTSRSCEGRRSLAV